jgi:HAD superfamily hydrolase (TIGR01549 family)
MDVSALVIDFSRVLIFAKTDVTVPSLNRHHQELAETPGYRVLEHFELNTQLLNYLREFNTHWPVILFTDGKLHSLPDIATHLDGIFKRMIMAEDLGYTKKQTEAYLALAYRIGRAPEQLLIVDDTLANIEAAKAAGCVTHQYVGNIDLISLLDKAKS